VKDVNFAGPNDEWVLSGSDDGNLFAWDTETGELVGIWKGDSSVVNVMQPHPYLPVSSQNLTGIPSSGR
jgi:WD40 repeat protein